MRLTLSLALAGLLSAIPAATQAATITGTSTSSHSHDGLGSSNTSPFFASVIDGDGNTITLNAANGLSGNGAQGGGVFTVDGTITMSGGVIPTGISLSYDVEFDMSPGTSAAGSPARYFTTRGGNTGAGLGITDIMGLTSGSPDFSHITADDQVIFGAATVSNLQVSNDPAASGFTVNSFTVDDVALASLRSSSFNNSEVATLSQGGAVINTFNAGGATPFNNSAFSAFGTPMSLTSGAGEITLENAAGGGFSLKGFGLNTDFSLDVTAVPEPGSFAALVVCGTGVVMRRRRKNKAAKAA